jgi:anti-sigma factor RsiW
MDCARVIEKLSAYVDGLLDEQSLELVEKHIGLCDECARELESMRTLVRTAREIDLISPPVELRKRILDAVKKSKQQLRDCKLAAEIMSAYIDGEADAQQESFLRNHISKCKECASELDSLRTLVKTTASIEPINPPRELRERISAAINAQPRSVKALKIRLPSFRFVPVLRLAGGMVAAGIMLFTITAIMPRSPKPVVRVVKKSAFKTPAVIGTVPTPAVKPTVFNKMKPAAVASATTVRWRTYRRATESKQSRVVVNSTAFVLKPVPKRVIEHPSSPEDVESSTGTEMIANEAASESIDATANAEPTPKPQIEPENPGKPVRGEVTVAAAFAEDAEQWIKRMKEEAALRKGADRSCGISIFSARF